MRRIDLHLKVEQNARAISSTPESRQGNLIADMQAEWLTITPEEWEPLYDISHDNPEGERLKRVFSSGLFLPNGYVTALQIEPAGQSYFGARADPLSLRHSAGLSLEDDSVMEDCRSIDFPNYPSMGAFKAILGYMHSRVGRKQPDFLEWYKEVTGDYPHGGSAHDTSHSGKYSLVGHRFIGAAGMMHAPEAMDELRKVPELADHFDSEKLISFRGSGAADHAVATGVAKNTVPELSQLSASCSEQLSRGISLN